ncbi:MAG: methyltransferase domain-containing protein [Pseudomonadota bacterium]
MPKTDPAAAREARFWDGLAERYAKKPVADQASYERKLALTQARLSPEMALLELGCGTGSTAIAHAPFVREVLATDISPKMVEIARRKAAAAGLSNVAAEVGRLEALAFPPGRFDAILSMSLLHLLEDPAAALKQVHGWLKPDGLLISTTPCLAESHNWLRFLAPLAQPLGLFPKPIRFFTEAWLREAHEAAGFTIEERWSPGPKKPVFLIARA